MKKLLACLLIAAGLFSCSQDQIIDPAEGSSAVQTKATRDRQKFYTLAYKINNSLLEPGAIATEGTLLAIVNRRAGLYGVDLYSTENGNSLTTIRDWSHDNQTTRIQHAPTAICIYGGRIYLAVAEEGKVYVYDQEGFSFITTIGNGNTNITHPSDDKYAVGEAYSIVGNDGKLLIRSRDHMRLYDVADITAENFEAIPYYAASKESIPIQAGTSFNQGCIGIPGYEFAHLTDADGMQVWLIQKLAEIPAGDEVAMVIDNRPMKAAPIGVAVSEDCAYLCYGTGGIKQYSTTGYGFRQDVVVKDNPLPEVRSLAVNRVENQAVLFISTPEEVWMVWVAPFERIQAEP